MRSSFPSNTESDRWSLANRRLVELAKRESAFRDPASFAEFRASQPIPGLPCHPWPFFVSASRMAQIESITLELSALFKSVPGRFFGGDAERIDAFYQIGNRELVERVIAFPDGVDEAVSRLDLVDTADGLRCLEYNAGSAIGGIYNDQLARAYLRSPPIVELLSRHGWTASHPQTYRMLFGHVLRRAVRDGIWRGGELNVAMILYPNPEDILAWWDFPFIHRQFRAALDDVSPALRGRLLVCGYEDLEERGEVLTHQGRPIHAVLEQQAGDTDPRVFRQLKAGRVQLYSGPITGLMSDKRNIALLSEHAESDRFTDAERRLIGEHIPWTRQVAPTRTRYGGEEVDLRELLGADRERLVLKKCRSRGGSDVVLGVTTAARPWADVVVEALRDGDWIVQEYQEPVGCELPDDTGELVPYSLIWGPLAFGDTFGGVYLRIAPQSGSRVVNVAQGAQVTAVLEIDEAPRTRRARAWSETNPPETNPPETKNP